MTTPATTSPVGDAPARGPEALPGALALLLAVFSPLPGLALGVWATRRPHASTWGTVMGAMAIAGGLIQIGTMLVWALAAEGMQMPGEEDPPLVYWARGIALACFVGFGTYSALVRWA